MPYFYVAYGNRIRLAVKQPDAQSAARYCFGVGVEDQCTVVKLQKAPKHLPQRLVRQIKQELIQLHKERTGNEVELL